jgi:hypothetical protein
LTVGGFFAPPSDGRFALIADRYKLLTNLRDGHELYDLDADPREKHDLAARHPDVVTAMVRQTASWADSVERSLRGDDYAAAGRS